MKKFFSDFKAFITRGNVIDMAVGVVVGSAFTAIVNSLVKDIITPFVGIFTGGVDFADKQYILASHVDEATGETVIDNAIRWGNFVQLIINFIIIAFVIFIIIKAIAKLGEKKRLEEEAAAAAKKAEEEAAAAKKAEEDAAKAAEQQAILDEYYANVRAQAELLREISAKLNK